MKQGNGFEKAIFLYKEEGRVVGDSSVGIIIGTVGSSIRPATAVGSRVGSREKYWVWTVRGARGSAWWRVLGMWLMNFSPCNYF